jgi:hypothetical protein
MEVLRVFDAPELVELGLDGLTELGELHLEELPELTDLDALSGVAIGPSSVSLVDVPSLQNLHGLAGVTELAWIWLARTGVADLAGLEQLERVDDAVNVEGNPALSSLRALTGLTETNLYRFTDNPALPSCDVDWLLARTTWESVDAFGNDDDASCP